jgi:hypothetical protein
MAIGSDKLLRDSLPMAAPCCVFTTAETTEINSPSLQMIAALLLGVLVDTDKAQAILIFRAKGSVAFRLFQELN